MLVESSENQLKSTPIDQIKQLVSNEFAAVDRLIQEHLHSHVSLIEEISHHIVQSGGKRLRPLIVLLVAKAFNYEGKDNIALAAVVEFIHTATLLHDDVVDNSSLRRGQETANIIWGNATSVLVGDFLYSRTFEILTKLKNLQVMDLLAKTTNAIAEGEVLQLVKRNDPTADEAHYLQIITNKTARLFQAAAEVATLICDRSPEEVEAMSRFGLHLGLAFQLVDDALDFMGNSEELGKNIGDDLAEGKPTLPIIHALRHSKSENKKIIEEAIIQGAADENLPKILNAITEADSINYTLKQAEYQTELALTALEDLPCSPYKDALIKLVHFSLHRKY